MIARAIHILTRPPVWVLMGAIRAYQLLISPLLPPACRFTPTCSHYAMDALRSRGLFAGSVMTVWRLLRCQPFCTGGHDPVPETGWPWSQPEATD